MQDFARTGAAVGATTATLEKTRILGAYLRTLDDDDLRRAAIFMSGRAFGPSQRRTLGLGWRAINKVVVSISGRSEDELSQIFRKHSDLGDWAGEALEGRTQNDDARLEEIAATLEAIRSAKGAAKAAPLDAILRRLLPEAARFLIKIIAGEMRIGLSEGLVEAAIAEAFDVPIAQVKRVHLITGDIGETSVRCKNKQFESTKVTPFQPFRFMLASPVETPQEAFDRMGAGQVWTEEKYDGVRCQLHHVDGRVEMFSRDLKETTAAFPELADAALKLPHGVMFDGEVLAHRDGRVLRFFELQHRLGRKVVDEELMREVPVALVIFDLLWIDGRAVLDEPLQERRRLLESLKVDHPRRPRPHLRRDARAGERGPDGQGSEQPVHTGTPRPRVVEAEAAARHARRGRDRGRMGPRQAQGRAVRLHLRCVGCQGGQARQRRQGVHRTYRRRDRDHDREVPEDAGSRLGLRIRGQTRGRAGGGVRLDTAVEKACQRLRASLPPHRAHP